MPSDATPEIVGGTAEYERRLRDCFARFPSWYVKAARVRQVIVSTREDVKEQIAMFEHGTRNLYVYPGIGALLLKAVGHELAHGCDDIFEEPHFFTATPEWQRIHKNQSHFDIPKYGEEPLEYFADMMVKLFFLGPEKLKTTNPDEVRFIVSWVLPTLQKEFS